MYFCFNYENSTKRYKSIKLSMLPSNTQTGSANQITEPAITVKKKTSIEMKNIVVNTWSLLFKCFFFKEQDERLTVERFSMVFNLFIFSY